MTQTEMDAKTAREIREFIEASYSDKALALRRLESVVKNELKVARLDERRQHQRELMREQRRCAIVLSEYVCNGSKAEAGEFLQVILDTTPSDQNGD